MFYGILQKSFDFNIHLYSINNQNTNEQSVINNWPMLPLGTVSCMPHVFSIFDLHSIVVY